MATILNIDTAVVNGSIAVCTRGESLGRRDCEQQKEQAAWIQPAIADLLKELGLGWDAIDAIAVTAGPGSYTGLRVGMATAKGLCYALKRPLITVNTLRVMALAARAQYSGAPAWFVPMIDARRMEVFYAVYNESLAEVKPPAAVVLEPGSFSDLPEDRVLLFSGNGNEKWKSICPLPNARYVQGMYHAGHLGQIAEDEFVNRNFADLAYAEPVYLKEFHTHLNN